MLTHAGWSTQEVRARWASISKFNLALEFEKGSERFYPTADVESKTIRVKVEHKGFKVEHSLLSYLTLEFQFLHEYISHALPLWPNASLEEAILLASTYQFYARSEPHDGIRSFLAELRRERLPDEFTIVRERVSSFAYLVGPENYSRFALSLSITPDETEFAITEKANLIAKMKKLPLSDPALESECEALFQAESPGIPEFQALRKICSRAKS